MSRPRGTVCANQYKANRPFLIQPADPSIRCIPLTRGKVTIVDAADYDWLSRWNWSARKAKGRMWYAGRNVQFEDGRTTIYMHQILLPCSDGKRADHKDRDGLNNRRSNLRPSTMTQNQGNVDIRANNTSGFRGVFWDKQHRKWRTNIVINGKRKHIGLFVDKTAAASAYNEQASHYFGEFARLNEVA